MALGLERRTLTGFNRSKATQFLRSLGRTSTVMLLSAVFCAFSSLGFVSDLLSGRANTVPIVLFYASAAGLIAVTAAMGVIGDPRWRLAGQGLLVAFVVFVVARPAAPPLADVSPHVVRVAELMDGLGCLAGFVLSFSLFMRFIGTEGTRYLRAHAEIELAREIHHTLVPQIEQAIGAWEFFGVSQPSQEVGGDLVDVAALRSGWIGYVADVAGHGIASGLLMGTVKSAMRTRLLSEATIGTALADVNHVLCDLGQSNTFVTLAALLLEGDRLSLAVAGHLPILRYVASTRAVEELSALDVPLGLFPDRGATFAPTSYGPGDVFALVTDGLTEVFNPSGDELGFDAVKAVLRQTGTLSLVDIATAIRARAYEFGPQSDDQTLLLIRPRLNQETTRVNVNVEQAFSFLQVSARDTAPSNTPRGRRVGLLRAISSP